MMDGFWKVLTVVAITLGLVLATFSLFDRDGVFFKSTTNFRVDHTNFESDDTNYYRRLVGNSCPGYDWTYQKSPAAAAVYDFDYEFPVVVNCTVPQYVGYSHQTSLVGFALNGVAIYGPTNAEDVDAIETEYFSFDMCGGHVVAEASATFVDLDDVADDYHYIGNDDADHPSLGEYHYHAMPGDEFPWKHNNSSNLNFNPCPAVTMWYTESSDTHSPMIGIMLDGIPLYGPRGADGELPVGLDGCNGHATDLDYYHYHVTSEFPYVVNCLWGKTYGNANSELNNSATCVESDYQSDYSSLYSVDWSYGGDGGGNEDGECGILLTTATFKTWVPNY